MIKGIDTAAARGMPGVLAVYTGADLEAAGYGTLKCIAAAQEPRRHADEEAAAAGARHRQGALRRRPGRLRGGQTAIAAKEAAEAVALDIEPLPAVTLASEAVKPGAPLVFDDVPDNVALDYHYGDAEKVKAAFAAAAHVTRLALRNTRLVVNAMEPRAAVAEYDAASERFTIPCRQPGRVRAARPACRNPQHPARQGAGAHRQCRAARSA